MRTIAHLSDLHFGRVEPAVIEALRRRLKALVPDLVVVSGDLTQREDGPALRQGFDHQNAGHDRRPGKVSLNKLLVRADLFDTDDSLEGL